MSRPKHVSEDGVVRECTTTPDKCPVKGPDGEKSPHFTDEAKAKAWAENTMKKEFGSLNTLSKTMNSEPFLGSEQDFNPRDEVNRINEDLESLGYDVRGLESKLNPRNEHSSLNVSLYELAGVWQDRRQALKEGKTIDALGARKST